MTDIKKSSEEIEGSNKGVSQILLNELFTPTLDLSIDYSEIYIDDIIDNEGINQIPIIKSIVGLFKGGLAINQFWFAKKLLIFIQTFNDGSIHPEKLEAFKNRTKNDNKFAKKISEQLMIHIDRNIEVTKTKVISNLFKAFINKDIDYKQFSAILLTLNDLNPKAFNSFVELEKINFEITSQNHKEIGPRNFENEAFISISGFAIKPSGFFSGFKLTDDGEKLFKYGIKPVLDNHY